MASKSRADTYVLRSSGGVVAYWIGTAILIAVVAVPLAHGSWALLGFVVLPALLLDWVLWIVLYRPAVHYDAEHVVVVNVGRIHEVPWALVTQVHQGPSLRFSLEGGRHLDAWGVASPRRPSVIGSAVDRRSRTEFDPQRHAEVLESYRESAPPATSGIARRWDAVPLIIGAVLVIALVIELVIHS